MEKQKQKIDHIKNKQRMEIEMVMQQEVRNQQIVQKNKQMEEKQQQIQQRKQDLISQKQSESIH